MRRLVAWLKPRACGSTGAGVAASGSMCLLPQRRHMGNQPRPIACTTPAHQEGARPVNRGDGRQEPVSRTETEAQPQVMPDDGNFIRVISGQSSRPFALMGFSTLPPQGGRVACYPMAPAACVLWKRNNSRMLWVRLHSVHSPFTFSRPRIRNRLSPRPSLIWPNTGSGIVLRLA